MSRYTNIIIKRNPKLKLLFENVRMKKEWQDIIVNTLQEINPKLKMYIINSSIVSAQNRVRMYITDFEFDIPEDKGLKTKRHNRVWLCRQRKVILSRR